MSRGKEHTAEQIVNLLRQVEVGVVNGKTLPQACKEMEIVELTYYRWREEYGGLMVDQAQRLKELEQENAKLKRLVSELSLEKLANLVLIQGADPTCWPLADLRVRAGARCPNTLFDLRHYRRRAFQCLESE